jgi:hypothetical protein
MLAVEHAFREDAEFRAMNFHPTPQGVVPAVNLGSSLGGTLSQVAGYRKHHLVWYLYVKMEIGKGKGIAAFMFAIMGDKKTNPVSVQSSH